MLHWALSVVVKDAPAPPPRLLCALLAHRHDTVARLPIRAAPNAECDDDESQRSDHIRMRDEASGVHPVAMHGI